MFAFGFHFKMFQQQHNAMRGSRYKSGETLYHIAHIDWMESIHILIGVNGINHLFV